MSLPASNAMARALASHLWFWRPHPVAFGRYAHRRILTIFGPEVPLEKPKLRAVHGFTDTKAVRVTKKSIVTVECSEHSLQQGPCRPPPRIEGRIVGKPKSPTVVEMRYARSRRACLQKIIEVAQSTAQGFESARALVTVMGIENTSDKTDPLIMALQSGFGGVQAQMEAVRKEGFNPHLVCHQSVRAVRQKHDIIHVANISGQSQLMLDVLVELIEVNVGKELARVTADRQATSARCAKKRFMRRNKSQKLPVATFARGRVGWIMGEYSFDRRPKNGSSLLGQWASFQIALQDGLQHGLVDARKEGMDVDLAVPDMIRFAEQRLQFAAGGKRTAGRAVCVIVVDETLVPPGFELSHDPVLADAIRQSRREDFARFWVSNNKNCVTPRAVSSGRKGPRQWQDKPGQINQSPLRSDRLLDICGASEKLRNDQFENLV